MPQSLRLSSPVLCWRTQSCPGSQGAHRDRRQRPWPGGPRRPPHGPRRPEARRQLHSPEQQRRPDPWDPGHVPTVGPQEAGDQHGSRNSLPHCAAPTPGRIRQQGAPGQKATLRPQCHRGAGICRAAQGQAASPREPGHHPLRRCVLKAQPQRAERPAGNSPFDFSKVTWLAFPLGLEIRYLVTFVEERKPPNE